METELTSCAVWWRLTAVKSTAAGHKSPTPRCGNRIAALVGGRNRSADKSTGCVGVYWTVELACAQDDCAILWPRPGATGVAPSRGRLRAVGRSCQAR